MSPGKHHHPTVDKRDDLYYIMHKENKIKKNEKGFSVVETMVILLVIGLVGFIGWYVFSRQSKTSTETNSQAATSANKNKEQKSYHSATEGFTLHYPTDWKIETNSSNKRDFSITSNDGIKAKYEALYVGDKESTADQTGCGHDSACFPNTVRNIDDLNVNGLGKVLLITTNDDAFALNPPDYALGSAPRAYLHIPLNSMTRPKVGVNQHDTYSIAFSLPSKTPHYRFALYVTDEKSIKDRSVDDFFNKASVKQGLEILKSLSY